MSQKSAMITIVGRPNVGKSTLINHLVGEKIAIVSHKPQTTRNRICGIVTHEDTQLVFVDTPGFHKPRTRLGDYMNNVVHDSVADVDAALLLVEPVAHIGPQEEELLGQLRAAHAPVILVINKIDTVEKENLLAVIAAYAAKFEFDAVVPVSAKFGDGIPDLLRECARHAADSPVWPIPVRCGEYSDVFVPSPVPSPLSRLSIPEIGNNLPHSCTSFHG